MAIGHPCIVQLGVGWLPAAFGVKFFAMIMMRGWWLWPPNSIGYDGSDDSDEDELDDDDD